MEPRPPEWPWFFQHTTVKTKVAQAGERIDGLNGVVGQVRMGEGCSGRLNNSVQGMEQWGAGQVEH